MTVLGAPGQSTALDLEAMAALELDADYVVAYIPPRLLSGIRHRLIGQGLWELLTVADYEAGHPPRDDWTMEASRSMSIAGLAAWARALLGYPVALEPDTAELKAGHRFARWHQEPVYWVRRNT